MVREQVRGTQDRPVKTVAQAPLVLFAHQFLAYANSGVAESRLVVLPTQVMSQPAVGIAKDQQLAFARPDCSSQLVAFLISSRFSAALPHSDRQLSKALRRAPWVK